MKRILHVLLGAIAGAIGLPLLMWICENIVSLLFPAPPRMFMRESFQVLLSDLTHSIEGRITLFSGFLLSAASVVFLRGGHTFGSRLGIAICSAGAGACFIWRFADEFQNLNSFNLAVRCSVVLYSAPYYLSPILWALGLFFFAVLARRKSLCELLP